MPKLLYPITFFVFLLFGCVNWLEASHPQLTSEGIKISLKGVDDITISYPSPRDQSQNEIAKIIERKILDDGKKVRVQYDTGTEIELVDKGGTFEMSAKNPPANLVSWRFDALLPFALNEGGKYRFDETQKDFPLQKPDKPHLYQGHPKSFSVTSPTGASFGMIDLEQGSFIQLQDNREWNWPIFQLMILWPYNKDHAVVTIKFSADSGSGGAARKIVDRFGQDANMDFPAKIKSDEELQNDLKDDETYYASFLPIKRDSYGGFPNSEKSLGLKKTGFFHVEKVKGRWFLVDPDGNAFFHLGICCFGPSNDYTYTEGRTDIFDWLPPKQGEFATAWHPNVWWNERAFSFYVANCIRKFGKPYDENEWASRMIDRVRALGFTSAGSFSPDPQAFTEKNFPRTAGFSFWGLGYDIPGAREFFDPFNEEVAQKIDKIFADTVAPKAEDKLIIGYYLANEQGVEDLPRALATLEGTFAAKKALVEFLNKKYETVEKFNKAWNTDYDSFDALQNQGLPMTTRQAGEDMSAFVDVFLEKYYSLLQTLFRKYDKNHLLLGSRWQPGTANNESLVRICAKYCDIVSVNYYTTAFDRPYLDRLHRWSGDKPFFLSEWHYTSTPDTGLPGGLGSVKNQKERGLAYRNYVEQAAATGYVVGIEWFTLIDQARSGRYFEMNTGERANTGLFAVTDRPWKEFVEEAYKTNARIASILAGKETPFQFDDPRFVPKGLGRRTINAPWIGKALKVDGSRDDWPGVPPILVGADRRVMGTDGDDFSAAFRLSWDEKNLYIFVDVMDKTPGKNDHQDGDLWQGDCIEIFLGSEEPEKPGRLIFSDRQILLGAASTNRSFVVNESAKQVPIESSVVLKSDGSGYFLEAAIPFKILTISPKEGQELLFDLAVDDSENGRDRQRQYVWNGSDRVSGDRGSWGILRLSK